MTKEPDDIAESVEPPHKSVWVKIEEATGGMHKPAPRAGDQQEGNFEGIESSHVAERD
jgi:hypothetical protein